MENRNNFTLKHFDKGRDVEKLADLFLDDFLTWNTSRIQGQFDGDRGKADFDIKGTNIKLEFQSHNFNGYVEVFLPKRRFWNYIEEDGRVKYTSKKDLSGVYFICSDGFTYLRAYADSLILGEELTNCPNANRNNGEKSYRIQLDQFKQESIEEFRVFLTNARDGWQKLHPVIPARPIEETLTKSEMDNAEWYRELLDSTENKDKDDII